MAGSTVISPGTRIAGPLFSKDDLTIDGTVEGPVTGEGRVTIGPSADVHGEVCGSEVTIAGPLRWNVRATVSIRLLSSAEVQGDLAAPRIAIDEGAVLEGQVRMLRKPAAAAAATTATARPAEAKPTPTPTKSSAVSTAPPPKAPANASPPPATAREIPTLAVPGKKTLVRRTR
jgi:cytoskeletal protein CcmA (bactofilin family)